MTPTERNLLHTSLLLNRITHCREINHRRNTGKILHQNPCRAEVDLRFGSLLRTPTGNRFDVLSGDGFAIFLTQQIFQQNLGTVRQPGQIKLIT